MAAAGPKKAVDGSPLPFSPTTDVPSEQFAEFVDQFVCTPSGKGAREPMVLRDWQRELVSSVFDPSPRPRTAGWMLGRGNGKTTLVAALGLWDLFLGEESANIIIVAVDERQSRLTLNTARRIVELNEDLSSRVQVFQDRLFIPERNATLQALPASPAALEGLNVSLAIVDELGVVNRDAYEVLTLAQGKREQSTLIGIGTPGPTPGNVLETQRQYALENPEDTSLVWREFSAAGFEDHPVDCLHCAELANPALGDFLFTDALQALLPPKTRESTYRRARLAQFPDAVDGSFLPDGVWAGLAVEGGVPDGSDVVIALDGSFSEDTTSLLVMSASGIPHADVLQVWEKPPKDPEWRVPVLEVEQAIRVACKRWKVREVVADPFRWQRTLQVLAGERIPVVEFPWSPARVTEATSSLYDACLTGALTHSGDARLAAHVGAAVLREDVRGVRIDKTSRSKSARKIDLAACLVMAYSRAAHRTINPPRRRVRSFTN